jgi:hypothetical protein
MSTCGSSRTDWSQPQSGCDGEPVAQSTGRVPSELLVWRWVAGASVRESDRAELIVWVAMNLS